MPGERRPRPQPRCPLSAAAAGGGAGAAGRAQVPLSPRRPGQGQPPAPPPLPYPGPGVRPGPAAAQFAPSRSAELRRPLPSPSPAGAARARPPSASHPASRPPPPGCRPAPAPAPAASWGRGCDAPGGLTLLTRCPGMRAALREPCRVRVSGKGPPGCRVTARRWVTGPPRPGRASSCPRAAATAVTTPGVTKRPHLPSGTASPRFPLHMILPSRALQPGRGSPRNSVRDAAGNIPRHSAPGSGRANGAPWAISLLEKCDENTPR